MQSSAVIVATSIFLWWISSFGMTYAVDMGVIIGRVAVL